MNTKKSTTTHEPKRSLFLKNRQESGLEINGFVLQPELTATADFGNIIKRVFVFAMG